MCGASVLGEERFTHRQRCFVVLPFEITARFPLQSTTAGSDVGHKHFRSALVDTATLTPTSLQRDAKFAVKRVTFTSRPSCQRSPFASSPSPACGTADRLADFVQLQTPVCPQPMVCVVCVFCGVACCAAQSTLWCQFIAHRMLSVILSCKLCCRVTFSAPSQFCLLITGISVARRQAVLKIICRINSYLKISQRETKQILGINRSTASHCQRQRWRALTHSVND